MGKKYEPNVVEARIKRLFTKKDVEEGRVEDPKAAAAVESSVVTPDPNVTSLNTGGAADDNLTDTPDVTSDTTPTTRGTGSRPNNRS